MEFEKIKDSENQKEDIHKIGYFKKNSCYYFQVADRKGNFSDVRVSNFLLESLYNLTDGTNDSIRIIKLQRSTGEIDLIEVRSSETSLNTFETILKTKRCTFKGDNFQLKTIFEDIMNKEKNAVKINNLGWQPEYNIYAFADSIITPENEVLKVNGLGIVEYGENVFYLPAFSDANLKDDSYQNDRMIIYQESDISFYDWSKLIYDTFGNNGIIAIQYTVLSLFRDIVYNELGFFPFLFLFGGFGSGKTSLVKNILGLFGKIKDGIDLGNTTVPGLSRELSQRVNGIFYLKEFTLDNSEIANRVILTGYDGVGRTTGEANTGNTTKKHSPKSGMFFDGNYLPIQKDAVFSRLIVLIFEYDKFTEAQKENFNTLESYVKQGLGQILKEILKYREDFRKQMKTTYFDYLKELDDIKELKSLPDRLKNHISLIITAYKVLEKKLNFGFDWEILVKEIIEYTQKQNDFLQEIKDVSIFWQSFDYAIKKGYIEDGKQYVKEETEFYCHIYIRYEDLYSFYLNYCKENSMKFIDKISLRELLTSKSNKNFILPNQKSRPNSKAHTHHRLRSAYKFECKVENETYSINGVEINFIQ